MWRKWMNFTNKLWKSRLFRKTVLKRMNSQHFLDVKYIKSICDVNIFKLVTAPSQAEKTVSIQASDDYKYTQIYDYGQFYLLSVIVNALWRFERVFSCLNVFTFSNVQILTHIDKLYTKKTKTQEQKSHASFTGYSVHCCFS